MPLERKWRYCPQCDETIEARREVPSFLAHRWLLWWLLGEGSKWRCSQCGALLEKDPDERRRHRLMALWIVAPAVLFVVLLVIVLALSK
ncbi:MAG TPA: hypothetical protein VFH53_05490 [Phycisphaerae bacterium]|nr:hypothetical protein [Phycisphaerae bacterium]